MLKREHMDVVPLNSSENIKAIIRGEEDERKPSGLALVMATTIHRFLPNQVGF